jgi:hypothetical protein
MGWKVYSLVLPYFVPSFYPFRMKAPMLVIYMHFSIFLSILLLPKLTVSFVLQLMRPRLEEIKEEMDGKVMVL